MKKSITKSVFLLATLLAVPGFVSATPAISNAPATIQHDQSVTVSGSGFGAKTTAAPKKWDTFENGSNGSYLKDVDSEWHDYHLDGGVTYFNSYSHSGSLSVGHHNTDDEQFTSNYYTYSPGTEEIFVSYWYRVVGAGPEDNTILKLTRLTSSAASGGGGHYTGVGTTGDQNWNLDTNSELYCNFHNGTGETSCTGSWTNYHWTNLNLTSWFRVDLYKKLSTAGVADGVIYNRIFGSSMESSGDKEIFKTDLVTRDSGQTFTMDNVLLGTMDGSNEAHDYYVYMDDVYIDTTAARIEICDSSTWADRAHCEIQIPSAWNDTSATFNANNGSFSDGQAYLYVVDGSGVANASGYPITLSSTPDTTAPANPSGLSVS